MLQVHLTSSSKAQLSQSRRGKLSTDCTRVERGAFAGTPLLFPGAVRPAQPQKEPIALCQSQQLTVPAVLARTICIGINDHGLGVVERHMAGHASEEGRLVTHAHCVRESLLQGEPYPVRPAVAQRGNERAQGIAHAAHHREVGLHVLARCRFKTLYRLGQPVSCSAAGALSVASGCLHSRAHEPRSSTTAGIQCVPVASTRSKTYALCGSSYDGRAHAARSGTAPSRSHRLTVLREQPICLVRSPGSPSPAGPILAFPLHSPGPTSSAAPKASSSPTGVRFTPSKRVSITLALTTFTASGLNSRV